MQIRFDTPFQVVVGTTYMIAVGYPVSTPFKILSYSAEAQSTIKYGPIACVSGGNIHYRDLVATGYPNVTEASVKTACLSPLFKEDIPVPVTAGYGPELSTRDTLINQTESYQGNTVSGQMYSFDTPGAIFGIEWYSPTDTSVVPGGLWEASVYSDGGATLHRQYYGTVAPGVGWKKIYFDTPFPVQVTHYPHKVYDFRRIP